MNSSGCEYVGLNSATGLKRERDLLDIPPEIKFEAVDFQSDYNETKCGNIFISNNGKYTFVCEFCIEKFDNLENFGVHLQSKHLNDDELKGEPPVSTDSATELQIKPEVTEFKDDDDAATLDNADNVSCYSPNSNESQTEVEEEEEIHEEVKSLKSDKKAGFYCDICKRSLKTKKTFARHNERHKNNTLKTAPKPKKKKETNDPSKTINCELCSNSFDSLKKFKQHSENVHGDEIPLALKADPQYLRCIFCYQIFTRVTERVVHEKTHTEERPYRCLLCARRFLLSNHRDMHDWIHPENHPIKKNFNHTQRVKPKRKQWPCGYCGKILLDRRLRRNHERIHTEEKPFQCEECGKSFRVSGQLSAHRKRHLDIKDYKCVCGKAFFTKKALKDHEAMHTKERPFVCTVCGKSFPRKKALQVHEQLHSDVKRYECTFCGKRFAQCAGLHSHRKVHHGDLVDK